MWRHVGSCLLLRSDKKMKKKKQSKRKNIMKSVINYGSKDAVKFDLMYDQ